ncbi:MAG: hypothetical protein A2343_00390, partial [Candidatus Moranbacteria bacterium RIFOXYB12_FULL_35_8]
FFHYQKTGNTAKDLYLALNEIVEKLNVIKIKEKATFFRLLAVMINAGIPIVESLLTLAVQTNNPRFKKIIIGLADDIKSGKRFSDALSKYPDVFDDSVVGMIQAGEFSGRLNNILQDIATDTENSAAMKSKIKGALTYPIVVLLLLATAIVVLMTMVIPKIMALFTGTNMPLPQSTLLMIGLSNFVSNHLVLIILTPVILFFGIQALNRTPIGKFYVDSVLLILPVFGDLNKKAALSRLSRVLSNLIKSGIPIIDALKITANGVGNEVYKKKLILSSHDTAQGIPLGENLKGSERIIPSMVISMIAIGEKTGEIATILDKVAEFYEGEVDVISKNLSKLLEPLILVVVGLTVGGIVAAIMEPIISLTDIADKI